MWCSRTEDRSVVVAEGSRDPAAPTSDEHRRRTQDLLGFAAGRGHLELEDLDARLAEVWSAETVGELARIEAGLPELVQEQYEHRLRLLRQRAAAQAEMRGHATWYAVVMLLLVAMWLAGGLTGGDWYPWPLWPAAFWGMAVAGRIRTARAAVP